MNYILSADKCLRLYRTITEHGKLIREFVNNLILVGNWHSNRCVLTWKMIFTPHHRLLFQLTPSTPKLFQGLLHTPTTGDSHEVYEKRYPNGKERPSPIPNLAAEIKEGIAYIDKVRMLPTPRTCSAMGATITSESANDPNRFPNLETVLGKALLPTPQAAEMVGRGEYKDKDKLKKRWEKGHQQLLNQVIMMIPTPSASDFKNQPTSKSWKEKGSVNYKLSNPEIMGNGIPNFKLQPNFVEWMMGFPLDWTDLNKGTL